MSEEKESNKGVELEWSQLGLMKFDSGEKPKFTKLTPAIIKDVKLFNKNKTAEIKVDSRGNEFTEAYLQVFFDVEGKELVENYGGLRFYDSANPRPWIGEDSQLGKLTAIVEQTFGKKESVRETYEQLKQKKCMLLTETTSYQGTSYLKQVIKQFVL
jgi:hypothetical protein